MTPLTQTTSHFEPEIIWIDGEAQVTKDADGDLIISTSKFVGITLNKEMALAMARAIVKHHDETHKP